MPIVLQRFSQPVAILQPWPRCYCVSVYWRGDVFEQWEPNALQSGRDVLGVCAMKVYVGLN